MKDIQLRSNGDLYIDQSTGDIMITDSIVQAIRIRLLWFYQEWRLGTDYGIPYFEDILVKNPSDLRIRQLFRDAILSVDEVSSVKELTISVDNDRKATIKYIAVADGEEISEEVSIGG